MKTLEELKAIGEAPEWLEDAGFQTLTNGYLQKNETPRGMYVRVSKAAAVHYPEEAGAEKEFFDAMWKNWLCLATPVASNMGASAYPISCNSIHLGDSITSIFTKISELAALSAKGAGVGFYCGDVRGRGEPIGSSGAKSEGIIPWLKIFDATTIGVNQGSTRRGASAAYLPVDHPDIEEFLDIRRPTGDANRRCLNLNHGVVISDAWMNDMLGGNKDKRQIWQKILLSRVETGEPYLLFSDNVNDQNPECYKANGLDVKTSNICSEIVLHTSSEYSFVCCLSSINLVRWEEWKDTSLIRTCIRFLDAVLEEYIIKTEGVPELQASRRSAIAGRAVGLGALGWHTLLQERGIPFDSFDAMSLNATIFKKMRKEADAATEELAKEKGEPEWCKGFGRRNSHCIALAPTVSNALISGGFSPSIEPLPGNLHSQKSAKGTFIRKNKTLEKLFKAKGIDTPEIWKSIVENAGSVRHLKELSDKEKEIFLTAREINQHAIIKQAAQRQKYIDQAQSINLFFGTNSDPKYIHDVHVGAWEQKVKSLYYFRSEGRITGDLASRSKEECAACDG